MNCIGNKTLENSYNVVKKNSLKKKDMVDNVKSIFIIQVTPLTHGS